MKVSFTKDELNYLQKNLGMLPIDIEHTSVECFDESLEGEEGYYRVDKTEKVFIFEGKVYTEFEELKKGLRSIF